MNILAAVGNLGRDCELRFTADQTPVGSFSFALSSGYGKNAKTTWLECSVFGKRAETLEPMLKKGTKIAISGEFYVNEWKDKEGNLKSTPSLRVSDVTLLDKRSENSNAQETRTEKKAEPSLPDDGFQDDIPF
jgi:single-strand DNA-binding protein